jgi:hypothetical protein
LAQTYDKSSSNIFTYEKKKSLGTTQGLLGNDSISSPKIKMIAFSKKSNSSHLVLTNNPLMRNHSMNLKLGDNSLPHTPSKTAKNINQQQQKSQLTNSLSCESNLNNSVTKTNGNSTTLESSSPMMNPTPNKTLNNQCSRTSDFSLYTILKLISYKFINY